MRDILSWKFLHPFSKTAYSNSNELHESIFKTDFFLKKRMNYFPMEPL